MASLRVGTSGWSYKDWDGVFYPAGTSARDYLTCYAERFDIVEVDSTYYRMPAPRTVSGWFDRTPDRFQFAVKTPSVITHEKILLDCDDERRRFLDALAPLGHKLHSILLQFGYFNKQVFSNVEPFFERLDAFLGLFPRSVRLAVEIRNRSWLVEEFFAILRNHGAACALAEHAWMPPVEATLDAHDCITADFLYLRLIGDRKGIEKITTTWDKTVVDRRDRVADIARAVNRVLSKANVVTFINNHFAGHAPAGVQEFLDAMATAADPDSKRSPGG